MLVVLLRSARLGLGKLAMLHGVSEWVDGLVRLSHRQFACLAGHWVCAVTAALVTRYRLTNNKVKRD